MPGPLNGRREPKIIFKQTRKQMHIMDLLFKAADAGEFITLVELWKRVDYHPVHKNSVKGTVNFLEDHGYISKCYGKDKGEFKRGKEVYLFPSAAAYLAFKPTRDAKSGGFEIPKSI